jgi:hypothetical protein
MKRRFPFIAAFLAVLLCAPEAKAWPAHLSQRIAKDALKLVPRSLAEMLLANEVEIFADARTSDLPALPLVYVDLAEGKLSGPTRTALGLEFDERAKALQGSDFRASLIALGATYRLAADLADPAIGLGLGADSKAAAIRKEFYSFVTENRERIPLVVSQPDSLRLKLEALPGFLADATARTPDQSALLRAEGQENGRVLLSREIDFRSPVFAVASLAYSRSVSAVAATWIAIWRRAGGDMMRQQAPQTVAPRRTQFDRDQP